MNKYRIVEETGIETNKKSFYIEEKVSRFFGGYKWKIRYELQGEVYNMVEFDNLDEAKNWVKYWCEDVNKEYHYCE